MKKFNISDLGNIDVGIISGSGLHGLSNILSDITKIGWNFDNSYSRLPKIMLSKIFPKTNLTS